MCSPASSWTTCGRPPPAHGLTFGPDPSTHSRCTLGGMIGNNACGSHSVAWGTTADNVRALDVLTYRGERAVLGGPSAQNLPAPAARRACGPWPTSNLALLRTGFPQLPRRISGYALDRLLPEHGRDAARAFTGSEGTLGVLTEATVRLVPAPAARALAVLGYRRRVGRRGRRAPPAAAAAADGRGDGGRPRAGRPAGRCRAAAPGCSSRSAATTPTRRWPARGELCRAADGTTGHAVVRRPCSAARPVADQGGRRRHRHPDARRQRGVAGLGGLRGASRPAGRVSAGLPRPAGRARAARRALRPLRRRVRPRRASTSTSWTGPGSRASAASPTAAADLVVSHGGSLSGEHGDGQARAELLPRMYGPELIALFARFQGSLGSRRRDEPGNAGASRSH